MGQNLSIFTSLQAFTPFLELLVGEVTASVGGSQFLECRIRPLPAGLANRAVQEISETEYDQ